MFEEYNLLPESVDFILDRHCQTVGFRLTQYGRYALNLAVSVFPNILLGGALARSRSHAEVSLRMGQFVGICPPYWI